MTNPTKDWHTDWRLFVEAVAEDFRNGLSDEEVSNKYADQKVTWIGNIDEVNFHEFYKSIRLDMPLVYFKTKDGRSGSADFIHFHPLPEEENSWLHLEPGTTVEIEAELPEGETIFPGINWHDIGDYVSVRLKDGAKLIRVIEK